MSHSAVIALSSIVLLVPGGPSRRMSRPAATAASTRVSSRALPTTRALTRSLVSLSCSRPSLLSLMRFAVSLCLSCLLDHRAGVDRERHAGDVPGLVGREEQDRVADVDRLHP